MRRVWLGVALTLVAHAAFGAVQYEFIQTSRSDADGASPMDISGRAVIDGDRTRVDFLAGNAYPPGTWMVSTDGARKLRFVDPIQKSFTEVNTLTIASAIGTSSIQITNLVPSVTKLDDKRIFAGIPTEHYRLTLTFDITVTLRNIPLKQSVRAEIDKWTTVRFGEIADTFGENPVETGNPEVDRLIAAETGKIRGFPLRQTIKIITMNAAAKRARPDSQLKIPSTRTMSREMTITSINELKPDERLFNIPAEFKKADFSENARKAQTQVLSLEPSSK